MKKLVASALACAGIFCLSSEAHAFNLGYHHDITIDALKHEGFSDNAIKVVLAGNLFSDILQPDESYFLINDDIQDVAQHLAGHLHFDQVYRPELIQKNFEILVRNARRTLVNDHQFATTDPLYAQEVTLIALGLSLHMIQDFYAHSNWAELRLVDFPSAPRDATYFDMTSGSRSQLLDQAIDDYIDLGLPRTQFGLFTHISNDTIGVAGAPAGTVVIPPSPKHSNLCKDWSTRAFFDDAYRTAYKASLEWIRFFQHVIVSPSPDCPTGSPSVDDPAYWEGVKTFSLASQAADELEEVDGFVKHKGVAHFMAQYGGAWKEPDRWAVNEIALSDLPDSQAFGILANITTIFTLDEPALFGGWYSSARQMGNDIFEVSKVGADPDDLDSIEISKVSIQTLNEDSIVTGTTFGDLPMTNTCEIQEDLEWLGTQGGAGYAPNWVKVAAPHDRDNDDGDGWFNFNDEDPGATSDYFAIWHAGVPAGQFTDYFEAINRDQSDSRSGWQVLLPLWNASPTSLSMHVWESDDVDTFDAIMHFLTLTIFDPADDGMDISPNGADELTFQIQGEPFGVSAFPSGVRVDARPYGALIRTSGNDDDTFGDFTASVDFQASPIARPTEVELNIAEVSGTYVPRGTLCGVLNPALVGCEPQTAALFKDAGLIVNATINSHVRRIPASDLIAGDSFNVLANTQHSNLGGVLQIQTKPAWNISYEGYVDSDTIPISFEIGSNSLNGFHIPSGSGRVEIDFDLVSETWAGHIGSLPISGVNGEDVTFAVSAPPVDVGLKFRITVDPGAFGAMAPAEQVAEYFCADPQSPDDNHIRPRLRLRNKGASAVPLSEFKLRYWYSSEGLQFENSWLDYVDPAIGADNVTRTFRKLKPRAGADGYMELGFKPGAGNLTPNSTTGEIQLRFNKGDWSNYHEPGDYSYDATKLAYAPTQNVTVYRNGVLISGKEPSTLAESQIVRAVEVFVKDEGFSESNVVKPRFYIVNRGNVTLPRMHVRYHFTVENGKTPVLEQWYLPNVTAKLENLGSNEWVADYRFEGPMFGPGTVIPDAQGFVSGIHYSDYSFFNKANDFSNPGSASFVKTNNVEVTFD